MTNETDVIPVAPVLQVSKKMVRNISDMAYTLEAADGHKLQIPANSGHLVDEKFVNWKAINPRRILVT